MHAVMILRGRGTCLSATRRGRSRPTIFVAIPSWSWHQFRASAGEPLGFLCLVNAERDRPRLPDDAELASLRAIPGVVDFLDGK